MKNFNCAKVRLWYFSSDLLVILDSNEFLEKRKNDYAKGDLAFLRKVNYKSNKKLKNGIFN